MCGLAILTECASGLSLIAMCGAVLSSGWVLCEECWSGHWLETCDRSQTVDLLGCALIKKFPRASVLRGL